MAGINGVGRVGIRNYVAPASLSSIVTNGLVLNLDASNPLSYSGTGTSWTDMSGNGNDATLVNGPTFNSANGGSIAFDGINDFARIAGNSESLSSITTYSFDIWLKASYSGNKVILEKGTNGKMIIQPDTSNSIWYGDAKMASINSSTIFNGLWKNYSVVQSSTNTMLYINGTLIYTASGGNSAANNSDILLMARSAAYPQAGNIGSFKVYNRVLSASEVLQNFDSTKERFGYTTTYTARTQALIAATGLTDTTKINAINTFDLGLISNSIPFGANDVLYLGFLGDSDKNKFNFIDTTKYQLTFYGGWDFTNGMKGNSVNTYAKTGWIPSARITNNDGGAIGAYLRNDFGNDQHFMGVGHAGSYFDPYPYGGGIYPSINDGNNTYYIPARKRGGIDIARTSNTNISCLSDSTTYNVTQNFTGKNGYEVYIGAMNHLGGPYGIYNNDIVCAYISANQWTQSQQLAFSALRSTMLTTLGLNV